MGYSRVDVKATKQKVKKFVRYKEGAEMYSMCKVNLSEWQGKLRQHINWTSWF